MRELDRRTLIRAGLAVGGAGVLGGCDPGGARPPVELSVCVPATGHGDVVMRTSGSARVPDGRVLALHFDRIDAPADGKCQA